MQLAWRTTVMYIRHAAGVLQHGHERGLHAAQRSPPLSIKITVPAAQAVRARIQGREFVRDIHRHTCATQQMTRAWLRDVALRLSCCVLSIYAIMQRRQQKEPTRVALLVAAEGPEALRQHAWAQLLQAALPHVWCEPFGSRYTHLEALYAGNFLRKLLLALKLSLLHQAVGLEHALIGRTIAHQGNNVIHT